MDRMNFATGTADRNVVHRPCRPWEKVIANESEELCSLRAATPNNVENPSVFKRQETQVQNFYVFGEMVFLFFVCREWFFQQILQIAAVEVLRFFSQWLSN